MSEARPSSSSARRSSDVRVEAVIRMNERRSMVLEVNNVGDA
tara:strand:+ start:103 stop:228 length:126 start_codon:yes stop_codon:yes gene_type:complete